MSKTMTALLGLAAGAGMLFAASTASALDSSVEAMAQGGTHQFYVWCTGADDYEATSDGSNWRDAQLSLWHQLEGQGRNNCWPVWQGLVD